jgi:small subunit ribosomal protein S6
MATKYEVMAIIVNTLDEKAATSQATDSVTKKIKELGGTVTFEDFWGARGFAYMIKKEKWGYYFVAQFEMDEEKILELKRDWNIDKSLVRFLVTKVHPKSDTPRPYTEMKKEWESLEKETTIEDKLSGMDAPKKSVSAKASGSVKTTPDKTPDKKEVSEEKTETKKPVAAKKEKAAPAPKKDVVDKKLDEILEDSSFDL